MQPAGDPAERELIERFANVSAHLSREFGQRAMILPNAEFFPDTYVGDAESVQRLLSRLQQHAGMQDMPIQLALLAPDLEGEVAPSQCGSGGCGPAAVGASFQRVVDQGESWQLNVALPELLHPVALTAELARALGLIFLLETHEPGTPIEEPLDITSELVAVQLGMGPLLLLGSYIYAKGCGGPRISQVTSLGPSELALATALFGAISATPAKVVLRVLPVTQKEAFDEAWLLVRSNPELIASLKHSPELVALGNFQLEARRSWLGRWFAPKTVSEESAFLLGERSTAPRPPARKPKSSQHDELKSLVNDAFDRS